MYWFFYHSVLRASTGLILIAFCAGMKPASRPENNNMNMAVTMTLSSTLGLRNITSASASDADGSIELTMANKPEANAIPAIPDTSVSTMDSNNT